MADSPTLKAYKLLRVRRDGTLGSLFINRKQVIPVGKWLKARCWPTKGFAVRPGWHCTAKMNAPHLSPYGRAWCSCEIQGYVPMERPKRQGGTWYIAQRMRLTKVVKAYPAEPPALRLLDS